MSDEFLTKNFCGKHIVELYDFLNSLDETYVWEGGVITDGLPIEYSKDLYDFVIITEKNLHSCILAKCSKNYKQNNSFCVNLTDDFLHYDLIVENVGCIDYFEGDLYQLAKELNSNARRTIH